MKPTNLKLDRIDPQVIERIYKQVWDEKGVCGGAETWFEVIMRFLEYKGMDLKKADAPKTGE